MEDKRQNLPKQTANKHKKDNRINNIKNGIVEMKKIKSALISVFYKDGLDEIVKLLDANGVEIYSTGGTYDYICNLGIKAKTVEARHSC